MVAIAITSGMYTVFLTASAAQAAAGGGEVGTINDSALRLMLGGPLIISLLGAASTMFMTSVTRQRDLGLLSVLGAKQPVLARSIVCESIIYCGTAMVVATGVVASVGGVAAFAFGRVVPGVSAVFGIIPGLLSRLDLCW